jgi:sec-independent protein translocase protein TatC
MAVRIPVGSRRANRPSPDEMTLVEHLAELRRRLVVSILTLLVTTTVCFIVYPQILQFFVQPYCATVPAGHSCSLYVTGPLDGFAIRIKIALYGGLFLGLPVFLWELWRFITPGLRDNERRYAVSFLLSSLVLFLGGAAVAYLVFPHALHWLQSIGGPTLKEIYSPNRYLQLILLLMVAFGASFEFPVILIALELVGVLSTAQLRKWRRWAIVGITVAVAVFTPSSDPFSMLALAIPLVVFYEGAILVGRALKR